MSRLCRVALLAVLLAPSALCAAQDVDPADDPGWLWNEAVLYRDEWGVPHIFADNTRAMAFAFGYAQAQDHLEPMLMAYRFAQGRAAEVLGPEVEEVDRLAIRLNHAGLAYEAYNNADPVTRDLCEGFALGVNTWITEHPDMTPTWADGVHPADVLALLHRYLVSQAPFDYPDAMHLLPATPSANAWAVGPALSQSREPMLAINPHANYDSPFQWYEAQVSTRDINMYGATLFGLPVILQGHNGTLGWALAPNNPDIADIYVEQAQATPEGDPNSFVDTVRNPPPVGIQYTDEESRRFFVSGPNGFTEMSETRRMTSRGPVVAEAEGHPLTWRVGGFKNVGALRQLFDMGLAQDLDAFRRALDRQQLSTFHVVYADAAGNIFYHYNALTGMRPDPQLVTGDQSLSITDFYTEPVSTLGNRYEWGAMLTPDTMPWLLNPESGYVQACGTPPWLATSPSALDPEAWPAWLVRDEDSYRAKRVRHLFSIGPRSFEDMQAMLFDTVSPLAAEAVPYLLAVADENPAIVDAAHPDLHVMLDILSEWNFLADPGSAAMTAFHVWWSVLRLDEDGQPYSNETLHHFMFENEPWFQEHVLDAASQAAQLLRNEYQNIEIPWGDVHVIARGDREYPLAGGLSGDPVFYAGDRLFDGGKWRVNEGYGFAMVVRFGEATEAVSLAPFGTSEDPGSPHYDDQLALMLDRRFKVVHFTRDEVERNAQSAVGQRLLMRPRHQTGTVFLAADGPMAAELRESAAPPATLPDGLAAFSTYLEPVANEVPAGFTAEFDVHIDDTVCDADDFESLYLYGYHPVDGWRMLDNQSLDADRRSLAAAMGRCEVVAVLGPEKMLRADPALVRPANAPRVAAARLATSDVALPRAQNSDAEDVGINDTDLERVASLTRTTKPRVLTPSDIIEENRQEVPPNIRGDKMKVVVPAIPPGFKPEPALPPEQEKTTPRPANPFLGRGASPSTKATANEEKPAVTESNTAPAPADAEGDAAPETVTEDLEPVAAAENNPVAVAENAAPEPAAAAPQATAPKPLPSASTPPPAAAPVRTGVVFSGQTPAEMQAGQPERASSGGFDLAPDPSQASPVVIGRMLEMRTPDGVAVFTMRSKQDTRAQAFPRSTAPAPFPAGLAPYTGVYEVMTDPPPASADTVIVMRVAPNAIATERLNELKLYAFDAVQGWKLIENQRVNNETRSFSAMDFSFSSMDAGVRNYVVLGPAKN